MEQSKCYERLCLLLENMIYALEGGDLLPVLHINPDGILQDGKQGEKNYHVDKPSSSRRYMQVMAVAALVMRLTVERKTMSQRDVYYTLKSLFLKQQECNTIILDLGQLLGLKRHEMGIYPTSKGLIAGLIRFRFKDLTTNTNTKNNNTWTSADVMDTEVEPIQREMLEEEPWVDCVPGSSSDGVKISSKWTSCACQLELPRKHRPRFLLVIEKEGIFHRLVEDEFYIHNVPSILVTGCGYPDVPTRACVSRIVSTFPDIIAVGICDYNSYGLAVLLTYRLPTKAMRFEGEGFTVDCLRWLGLRREAAEELQAEMGENALIHQQEMTKRDVRHAQALHRSPKLDELPDSYRNEVEGMLELRIKLELESIYSLGMDTISKWLQQQLEENNFI